MLICVDRFVDDSHYKKKRRSRKTPGDLASSRRGRGRGRGRRNNKGGDCDTPRSSAKRGNRQTGITSMQSSSNSPLNINEDSQPQILLPVEPQPPPLPPPTHPHEFPIPEKNPIVAAIEKRYARWFIAAASEPSINKLEMLFHIIFLNVSLQ